VKLPKRFRAPVLAVLAAAGLAVALALPAHAAVPSVCGNGGSGYCLNAWNGGPDVRMANGGLANDNYNLIPLSLMCHDGHVHANAPYGPCPFASGSGINTQLNGAAIEAVRDGRNGQCVGSSSADASTALEGTCPDALGNGGGWATIYAIARNSGCSAGNQVFLEDRYWSNAYGHQVELASGGNPGTSAFFATNTGIATCWGLVNT